MSRDCENDYEDDRLFAERTQDALDKFRTNKGMVIGPGFATAALARKAGVRAAEKLDRESDGRASDRVLLETAGKKGGRTGAKIGAIGGGLLAAGTAAAMLATGKGRAAVKGAVNEFGKKKALASAGLTAGALTAGGALSGGLLGRGSARRAVNDKLSQRDNAGVKDYMWGKK